MEFGFNEDQDALREAVRRFCEDKSPPSEVRRLMETEAGYDEAVWKQMGAELGLQGLHIPEAFGGQGFSFVELCIVLEEQGRALLCAPYFASVALAANAIMNAGSDADRKELLPGIASGETIATLAITESSGAWDATGISMEASGSHVLNGTKEVVVDGHNADLIVVAARQAGTTGTDGISLYTVAGDASGLTRTPQKTLDWTRKLAKLEFSDVEAKPLGEPGKAWEALSLTLDQAAVCLANEMVGGTQFCFEAAVQYGKDRHQFGRAIGGYQAIKHRLADLLLEVESAKSAAYYAAWAAASKPDEFPIVASLAKAYCSDAYFKMTAENIQIHGGIGFTWEHDAHLYYKRAKSSELFLGDPSEHREKLASRIGM